MIMNNRYTYSKQALTDTGQLMTINHPERQLNNLLHINYITENKHKFFNKKM